MLVKTKTAFTAIEFLIVVAIIAILLALLFPLFAQGRNGARGAVGAEDQMLLYMQTLGIDKEAKVQCTYAPEIFASSCTGSYLNGNGERKIVTAQCSSADGCRPLQSPSPIGE